MANKFEVANAPEGVPSKLVVGDYVQFKLSNLVDDYPVATHSAELVARITAGGASEIKITATENASYYLFTVPSSTSASYVAGAYYWQLEITETASGNRIVVNDGTFSIVEDLDANNADIRSNAKIMLDKIDSILSGKADSDVSSYSINNRSLSKFSFQELLEARNFYSREVSREKNRDNVEKGLTTSTTILARF